MTIVGQNEYILQLQKAYRDAGVVGQGSYH